MPFNVMIQLCRVTRASKLFQRNFYLPLLKPLSPKDALRRRIITGKDVLQKALEHWIPVLEEYATRVQRRRHMVKGTGKKRQRHKESMKYVSPFFDEELPYHNQLRNLISRKSKGRGQCYTYYVPEKNCTLVLTHQMERAIRDKDIIDIIMAQRHEKIIVKLRDGVKVTMPLCPFEGKAPFYGGEGWTRKEIEEFHHHGRETYSIAQLFEAKEAGLDEWELEMMRLANQRKKKVKGEGTKDWKSMLQSTVENMDWDEFEEESKEIVAQSHDIVDDEPINMVVDDMDKTCNVNEKLKAAGAEIMAMLPAMTEIPEILKAIQENSELMELAEISGAKVVLPVNRERFIPGQIVESEEGEIFVPGQTIISEDGEREYTPGFTVLLDDEPTLIPGLVMGNDPNKAMFLPGESTITESGELQFAENEADVFAPTMEEEEEEPDNEMEEVELEEEQNSEEEAIEMKPPPKRQPKELVYERPKRQFDSIGPKHRERGPKKPPMSVAPPEPEPQRKKSMATFKVIEFESPIPEKDVLLQEKERVEAFKEKSGKEEARVDKCRREIRLKAKALAESRPAPPKYQPLDPVKKSDKLKEFEKKIKKGTFFDVDYKRYLNKDHSNPYETKWNDKYQYRNTFESVGMTYSRRRIWKSVY